MSQNTRYLGWKEGGTLVSSLDRQGLVGQPKLTAQNVISNISKTSASVSSGFQTREN